MNDWIHFGSGPGDAEKWGFMTLRLPEDNANFDLIATWRCGHGKCNATLNGCTLNFSLVEIRNRIVESIRPIKLDDAAAAQANFVSEECRWAGWNVKEGELVRSRPISKGNGF